MSIIYKSPNRVGQSAVFRTGSPDYIDLSTGTALNNALSVLAAVSEGSLATGQIVGVYMYSGVETDGNYKVWTAQLDTVTNRLNVVTEERSVGSIANAAAITFVITDTSGILAYHRSTPEQSNVVTISGTTYTVTNADAGKTLRCTNASAVTLTFSTAITNGAQFQVAWAGTGQPHIARSGSDTINGASTTLALPSQWKVGWVYKLAAGQLEAYGFTS